jgi:hypothetical protein
MVTVAYDVRMAECIGEIGIVYVLLQLETWYIVSALTYVKEQSVSQKYPVEVSWLG